MSDRATTTASLTFESLYGTHHGWLKSWLTRKLQSAFDADDIAQTLFAGNGQRNALDDPRSSLLPVHYRQTRDGGPVSPKRAGKAYLEMLALMPEGERLHLRNAKANSRPYNSSTACWTG